MAFRSKGKLQDDFKQTAIDRIGQSEYNALDDTSKKKIDDLSLIHISEPTRQAEIS